MGRILLRSLGPVWPLGLLTLAGAGLLRALDWPAEAFIAALAAAALALLATPLTLLPGARLLAELRRADPGRAPDGSLWPGLSWALRVPPAAPVPAPVAGPMPGEETAAQMSAAVRAVASEIALLKRQGTEMRRSFSEAVEAGHRMATAAETAGLWFDDTARRSTEAAAALGQLQAAAAAQANSLGTLTDHAGQALALLSDAAPAKAWLEAVMARAPDLPEQLDATLERAAAVAIRCEALPERMAEQVAALEAASGRLQVMTGELPEQVASLGAVAQHFDAVAGLPGRFEAALVRSEGQATTLAAAAAQLEAALARTDDQMAGLTAAAARLDAVPSQVEAALAAPLGAMAALPGRFDAALARGDAQVAALAALAGVPERLDAALAQAGPLDRSVDRLAGSEARLEAATAALEVTTLRLGETLPQAMAGRLEALAAPLQRAVAGLTEAGEALGPMAAGMAGLVQQIPRLEAAIDRAAEAPRQTAEQLAAVTGAMETMLRQARPSPGRSVSARILGQLDAEAEPAVTATLLRLDGVETEVEQLLRRAEHLVEGPGGLAPVSPGLARHAPELLEGLDATIRQLQSVATAIAVAADRGSRRVAARA